MGYGPEQRSTAERPYVCRRRPGRLRLSSRTLGRDHRLLDGVDALDQERLGPGFARAETRTSCARDRLQIIRGNNVSLEAMNRELLGLDLTRSVPSVDMP